MRDQVTPNVSVLRTRSLQIDISVGMEKTMYIVTFKSHFIARLQRSFQGLLH